MSRAFLFPRSTQDHDEIVLSPLEQNFHLDLIKVIRNQVQTAEAMLIVKEISGSKLKKIKAECHNLEQNYIKTRGLFFRERSGSISQSKERYDEEKFPEEDSSPPESEGGRAEPGPTEHSLGSDGGAERILESGPESEGR